MTKRLFLLERAVPAIQEGHERKNPESFSLSLLPEFRERVFPPGVALWTAGDPGGRDE
jgi:hypothetical protein